MKVSKRIFCLVLLANIFAHVPVYAGGGAHYGGQEQALLFGQILNANKNQLNQQQLLRQQQQQQQYFQQTGSQRTRPPI